MIPSSATWPLFQEPGVGRQRPLVLHSGKPTQNTSPTSGWEHLKTLLWSFVGSVFAQALDLVSSLGFGPGFEETNPFSRYQDHSFHLWHGIGMKALFLLEFSLMAGVLYFSFQWYSKKFAALVASIPLLYYSALGLQAAFSNALLHTGWYAP